MSHKKNIGKLFFILYLSFCTHVFSLGFFKDGIYSFDYERVLVSLDAAEAYKACGVNARQDSSKLATGAAVFVKDGMFSDPESGIVLKIGFGGGVKSPDNPSIHGKYGHGGKICYYGTYEENNQTVQIALEGVLSFSAENDRAGKKFSGIYSARDPGSGRNQVIWIENGLYMWRYEDEAEDDFSGWPMIVKSDGSFYYESEFTTRAIMYGMCENYVTSKTCSSGKFDGDGSLKLMILTKNSGTGQSENEVPVNYSAVKASESYRKNDFQSFDAVVEKGSRKRRSKSAVVFGANRVEGNEPEWYDESVVSLEDGLSSCGKKRSFDSETSLRLAEGIAVNQIIAYLGTETDISTEATSRQNDDGGSKCLYKTLEKISLSNASHEVVMSYVDEKTGWAYVKVKCSGK